MPVRLLFFMLIPTVIVRLLGRLACMLPRGISRLRVVGMLVNRVHINWLIVQIYLFLCDLLDKILLFSFRSWNRIDISSHLVFWD